MLNEAWTLLVNVDGSEASAFEAVGAELLEPDYKALRLPTYLQTVRAALFGAAPDLHMLHYRTRQLLACVHAGPLVEHVTALDPRITYDFTHHDLVTPGVFGPRVTPSASTPNDLVVTGAPTPPDASGKVYHRLTVTGDAAAVNVVRLTEPGADVTEPYDPLTRYPLPGTGLLARIPVPHPPGSTWVIELYARPLRSLAEIAEGASNLGEPVYLQLFGPKPVEPYKTFWEAWKSDLLPFRLAGLACAVAYRSKEVGRA